MEHYIYYPVEKILNKRKRLNKIEYLVKWRGYSKYIYTININIEILF